jgi:hypothetical protein
MSNHSRLDDETVERLLDGLLDEPRLLAGLLAAAAAPAFAADMAGEDAALAEFRAIQPVPSPRHRYRGRVLARLLTVKGAAFAAAFAAAGVALAAGTGVLPTPLRDPAPVKPVGSWTTHATVATSVPDAPRTGPDVAPSTALPGLCRAFLVHIAAHPDKAADFPQFTDLTTVAGGPEKVKAYCESLVKKVPESHPAPDHPTPPAHDTPTKKPNEPAR